MSMKLMAKAMEIKVGNPLRKLVLIKLADNASDQCECWPSYQYIADQCEISKRSVINHIAALCESGLVKKSPGKVKKVIQVISISFIWMVQKIYRGIVQIIRYIVHQMHRVAQELHLLPVQELHPEPVTLLNQSMNLMLVDLLTQIHRSVIAQKTTSTGRGFWTAITKSCLKCHQ